jgi:alpha-amylase
MVILQGFYWDCLENWWEELNSLAGAFKEKQFDQIWLPPVSRGMSGNKSMGYDIKEHYNLDSRFGNKKTLKKLINNLHQKDIKVMADLVMGHMIGGDLEYNPELKRKTYTKFKEKRFPKDYKHFCRNCGNCGSNNEFGETICYYNDDSYMKEELIKWASWLDEEIGFDSFRLDNLKDMRWDFVRDFSNAFPDKFMIGEYWDHNDEVLNKLIDYTDIHLFNFPLYYSLKEMCLNPLFPMKQITKVSADKKVNFLANHDIERKNRNNKQAIINNKELGYAYLMFNDNPVVVFWQDYFEYGLKKHIDKLIKIRKETKKHNLKIIEVTDDIYFAKRGSYKLLINNSNNIIRKNGVKINAQNYKVF